MKRRELLGLAISAVAGFAMTNTETPIGEASAPGLLYDPEAKEMVMWGGGGHIVEDRYDVYTFQLDKESPEYLKWKMVKH